MVGTRSEVGSRKSEVNLVDLSLRANYFFVFSEVTSNPLIS